MDIGVPEKDLEDVERAEPRMLLPGAQGSIAVCRKCGCADMRVLQILPARWTSLTMVFGCRHCSHRQRETVRMKACPECDSSNTEVRSRAKGYRKVRCRKCKHNFKIVD